MRYRRMLWTAVAALVLSACGQADPVETGQTSQALHGRHLGNKIMLAAVGASVTYGVGSTNDIGFMKPFRWYLMWDYAINRHRLAKVVLYNAAVPGATSDEVLEQVPDVLDEAAKYRRHVAVVGCDGGGNDIRAFLNSPDFAVCFQPDMTQCIVTLYGILVNFEMNFTQTVAEMREGLGDDTPMLVTTQYNPMLKSACDPTGGQIGQLGNAVFEGMPNTPLARGFNDIVRDVAATYDAAVVDTFYPLAADPEHLINDDCIHPNDAGYFVILQQFIDAWEDNF